MKSVFNKNYSIKKKQKQYKHLDIKERVVIETMIKEQLELKVRYQKEQIYLSIVVKI